MTNLIKLFLKEISEDNISIEDVPRKLRESVQEQLDKLNQFEESGE